MQEDTDEWRNSQDIKTLKPEERCILVVNNRLKGKTPFDADKLEDIRRMKRD